jgi:ABC-2 type transport system ATP-binding protein
MPAALLIEGLHKRYGDIEALRGIEMQVEPGEIFGFLGPNGAGKSTTIRILLDLIRPTSGRAEVLGFDCQRQAVDARRHIGYLASDPAFAAADTAFEVFAHAAALRGSALDNLYADELAQRLQFDPSRKVADLSRGNRQKVGFAQALLTRAPLLILDEPTTGLDPLVQEEVEQLLREVTREGRTVFFSSHILSEVQSLCTRAAVVREGLVVETFDLAQRRRLAPVRVDVTFERAPAADVLERRPPGVALLSGSGTSLTFELHDEAMDALVKWLASQTVLQLSVREPTLDEVFMRYYRAEDTPEAMP